jgi:hypothetical protein
VFVRTFIIFIPDASEASIGTGNLSPEPWSDVEAKRNTVVRNDDMRCMCAVLEYISGEFR